MRRACRRRERGEVTLETTGSLQTGGDCEGAKLRRCGSTRGGESPGEPRLLTTSSEEPSPEPNLPNSLALPSSPLPAFDGVDASPPPSLTGAEGFSALPPSMGVCNVPPSVGRKVGRVRCACNFNARRVASSSPRMSRSGRSTDGHACTHAPVGRG